MGIGTGAGGAGDGLTHAFTPPGIFDPGEVYVWGTLDEGICGRDALTTWWDPTQVQTGFACKPSSSPPVSVIDPRSNQLVYLQYYADEGGTRKLAWFTPDGDGTGTYPSSPAANDPTFVPNCSGEFSFWADPEGKGILYRCNDPCPCHYFWQSGEELQIAGGCTFRYLGYGGNLLVSCDAGAIAPYGGDAIQAPNGQLTVLQQPDTSRWFSAASGRVRARPDGFWVLDWGHRNRWSVGFDGTVTDDDTFPVPHLASAENCVLDATGAIYCIIGLPDGGATDQIIRTEPGAPSFTVVYDESKHPAVTLPNYGLFTGP